MTTVSSMPVQAAILDILRRGRIDGCQYYLPSGQLERKIYQETNEVLERIGGKWNRKAKAHVFEENPTDLLDLVYTTGEMPPRNPTAFFPTPKCVIEYMLTDGAFCHIPGNAQRILEPSAGKGNIAESVQAYCYQHAINASLDCCEIVPKFREVLQSKGFQVVDEPDFLCYQPSYLYDAVVMNPPFSVADDTLAYIAHVEHAWSLVAWGGVLLAVVPAGFAFRDDKRIVRLRSLVEKYGTWRKLEGQSFKESGTGVATVILSMQK